MIPINQHIQIEPVKHEGFIASMSETYDEVGIVLAIPSAMKDDCPFQIGDKVFFDSWLAAKYPKGDGEHYWLVQYENIRAYEEMAK